MLDNHCKIAAVLHIIMGAFLLLTLLFFMLFFGGIAVLAQTEAPFVGWIAGFGAFIASVIALFNFPLGTAAGGYAPWALLRK